MKKKIGLVFSGGGARGLFAVRILERMREDRFDFSQINVVSGVSVGSIVGAMFTQGGLNELIELFGKIENKQVYRGKMKIGQIVWNRIRGRNYILDIEPLHDLLSKHIDLGKAKASNILFKIGFTDLVTGKYMTLTQYDFETNEDYIRCIMASCSQPVIMKPQHFKTYRTEFESCSDGGIVTVSPIGAVLEQNPDEVIIINSSPVESTFESELKTMESVLLRAIDLTISESFGKDMKKFLDYNNDAINGYGTKKYIPATIYQTDLHEDSLDFEHKTLRQLRTQNADKAYDSQK